MKTRALKNLDNVIALLPSPPLSGPLKKLRPRRVMAEPVHENPREELRRLTRLHKTWTHKAVAITNMSTDRKNRETGEEIPCLLPDDVRAQMGAIVKGLQAEASALESGMKRALQQIPIYKLWLGEQFIARGPVLSAYLVSEIDIYKAVKSSNLRRYCGLAVINGRLERREGGPKATGGTGTFNSEIRMRLFQMFDGLRKAKNQPGAQGNKYLKIWTDAAHRVEQSERVFDRGVDKEGKWTGKIETNGKKVSARGFVDSYGWHKAADIFIEDLYVVWRAIEGLEVWPSYYAAKLGYEHGGKISVNAPRILSIREALDIVR